MARKNEAGGAGKPIGSAPRAFLQLSTQGVELEDERPSASRRAVAILLALMLLVAVPLFWASGAGSGDVPTAVPSSNSGANSGPGGRDDADRDRRGHSR